MDNFYEQLFGNNTENLNMNINLGILFKIPLIIFLIGNLFYAFMLVLKVKILVDTVNSQGNTQMRVLAFINLAVSIIGATLGCILILLG